jgi:hypothetical protein
VTFLKRPVARELPLRRFSLPRSTASEKIVESQIEALDPAVHLHARPAQRASYRRHVSPVLPEQLDQLLAPPRVLRGEGEGRRALRGPQFEQRRLGLARGLVGGAPYGCGKVGKIDRTIPRQDQRGLDALLISVSSPGAAGDRSRASKYSGP